MKYAIWLSAILVPAVIATSAPADERRRLTADSALSFETHSGFAQEGFDCDALRSREEIEEKLKKAGLHHLDLVVNLDKVIPVLIAPGFVSGRETIRFKGYRRDGRKLVLEWMFRDSYKVAGQSNEYSDKGDYVTPLEVLIVGVDKRRFPNDGYYCFGPYPKYQK